MGSFVVRQGSDGALADVNAYVRTNATINWLFDLSVVGRQMQRFQPV